MKYVKLAAALCLAAGLLLFPETVLNAVREAMYAWYSTAAPSLFPFMVLMPMITCREACALYERLLGKAMGFLTGLPGAAAPVLIIAMTAGSPAGALAAVRCGLGREDAERLLGCVCGLSPAFLISGIGAGMLGNPIYGRKLLQIQLSAQLVMLALTRFHRAGTQRRASLPPENPDCIRPAVGNILAVGGYMIFFSVIAALIARILNSAAVGTAVLCLLDVPAGARAVSALTINMEEKMTILAAMTGLGGVCIAVQNLSAAKETGARAWAVALMRGANAVLCALFAKTGVFEGKFTIFNFTPKTAFSTLIAAFLLIPACFSLRNTSFLNKRIFAKICRKNREKRKNPQDVVDNVDNSGQHLVIQKN